MQCNLFSRKSGILVIVKTVITGAEQYHMYLNDRKWWMFFLQSLHISSKLQRLLVVSVTHTCVHQLRDLQNLQDLSVSIQCQAVHTPADADLLCLLYKTSAKKRQNRNQLLQVYFNTVMRLLGCWCMGLIFILVIITFINKSLINII